MGIGCITFLNNRLTDQLPRLSNYFFCILDFTGRVERVFPVNKKRKKRTDSLVNTSWPLHPLHHLFSLTAKRLTDWRVSKITSQLFVRISMDAKNKFSWWMKTGIKSFVNILKGEENVKGFNDLSWEHCIMGSLNADYPSLPGLITGERTDDDGDRLASLNLVVRENI